MRYLGWFLVCDRVFVNYPSLTSNTRYNRAWISGALDWAAKWGWFSWDSKLKNRTGFPFPVLKPTQPIGGLIWYGPTKTVLFHHSTVTTLRIFITSQGRRWCRNAPGLTPLCSESARYQDLVWKSLMLCGRSHRSKHDNLCLLLAGLFLRNWVPYASEDLLGHKWVRLSSRLEGEFRPNAAFHGGLKI